MTSYYGTLTDHCVRSTDSQLVIAAIALCRRLQLSLWDGLIVQAAIESACTTLLTEDLQHGLTIGPLTVENPFAAGRPA